MHAMFMMVCRRHESRQLVYLPNTQHSSEPKLNVAPSYKYVPVLFFVARPLRRFYIGID